MDIVYLCRPGEDNEELRFSLRSLKNLADVDQVWFFGGKPSWVRSVRWYELPQWGNKHATTNHNLRFACEHPEVSDQFVLMNDDFYFMQKTKTIPTLNMGTVRQVLASYKRQGIESQYVDGMRRTLTYLEQRGFIDPLCFETHTPMVVDKDLMLRTLDCGPYQRRTVYGALAGHRGRTIRDVKVVRPSSKIPAGKFMSTQDNSVEFVLPLLRRKFPHRSVFE